MWYADPAGASDISTMRVNDYKVRQADNSLRPGIAAVSARLRDGTLRILKGRCPNLLAEAGLYTYGTAREDRHCEKPQDDHNHAMDALRYLLSRIDARRRVRSEDEPSAAEATCAIGKRAGGGIRMMIACGNDWRVGAVNVDRRVRQAPSRRVRPRVSCGSAGA